MFVWLKHDEDPWIIIISPWNQSLNPLRVHYSDVIACQITGLTIVYSTVYSRADQRKHQSFTSLAFVRGIHRGPVNSPHKWTVTRKMFPFDDIIMCIYLGIHTEMVTFSITSHMEMEQGVEVILSTGRQSPTQYTVKVWLLMTWLRKDPKHLYPIYCLIILECSGLIRRDDVMGNNLVKPEYHIDGLVQDCSNSIANALE